jgi:O-antigen biosynthesis protein
MRKPYLIRTPDFDPVSGGIRVMWGLYGWLLAKGEIAYINAKVSVPSVGIYPEIYHGNDLESETVVRYVLQTPGVMGTSTQDGQFKLGPTNYDEKDRVYVFSKIYDTFGVDQDHILFLPIINTKVFRNKHRKRKKTCYMVGKGKNLQFHPKGAVELTRQFAHDQEALADLLNDCHTFYCYDRLSAMMDIARLCGVRVKYYGDFTQEELEKYEPGTNGLGYWGEDKQLWTEAFRERYKALQRAFEVQLDRFIEETQK